MRLFRADGPVYEFISKFTDMVLLSLCWLVCSIPIVTVGASTAALYAVCFKMLKNEEGHVCRQFFSYFKSNFKQATLAWLILLPIGIIIAYMIYLYYFGMSVMDGAADVFAILVLVAAALYIITLTYVFACAARYENTPVQTVKNGIYRLAFPRKNGHSSCDNGCDNVCRIMEFYHNVHCCATCSRLSYICTRFVYYQNI